MCGIAGFVSVTGEIPGDETLFRVRDAMSHRGPDGAGIYISPDRSAALVHRRLAVIDLTETGHQPMSSPDGRFHLAYNGEVYNFPEIREDLSRLGYSFRGSSDAEVILSAYREWGPDCVSRFNGMFAFAVWDAVRRRLFLARDRLGVKPLYYTEQSGVFAFASELHALTALPRFRRRIDPAAVRFYFLFGYVPSPMGIWEGTRKLPPGHRATVGRSGLSMERYWDPLAYAAVRPVSPPEQEPERVAELERLLESAVRYRLVSDVPVGAFLSGGVDSSTVVALMQAASSSPVETFSVGIREKGEDEAPFARKVATALGTRHQEIYVEPSEAFSEGAGLLGGLDEPFADPSLIPTALVSRLARTRVTVSLSGDGGDELFSGYPRYRWARRQHSLSLIPRPARLGLAALLQGVPRGRAAKTAQALRFRGGDDFYLHAVGVGRPWQLEAMFGDSPDPESLPFGDALRRTAGLDPRVRFAAVDLATYLPDDILTKVDRASMAFSLEARVPFLDYRVVEWAMSLPPEDRWKGSVQKRILRKVLERRLPPALFDRPKRGFTIPVAGWLRTIGRGMLSKAVAQPLLPGLTAGGRTFLGDLEKGHVGGRADHSQILWALLAWRWWAQRNLAGEGE